MTCIDLMSKRSKQRKTPNAIKLPWIGIDLTSKRSKMLSYVANHSKPLNYKSDQNTMTCTDLMSKTSKQRWTTKVIKLDVKTSKNVELRRKTFKTTLNYKSDQNTTTCIDLMSKRSKKRKTPNAIKLPWICIDLTSKRSKMLSYVAKHSKQS